MLLRNASVVTLDPPLVERADLRILGDRIVERGSPLEAAEAEAEAEPATQAETEPATQAEEPESEPEPAKTKPKKSRKGRRKKISFV